MSQPAIQTAKRNTLLLSALFAATAILHFVRDVWFANRFGTGYALEAFELVFVLPSMIARFFGGGVLPAIVPRSVGLLTGHNQSSDDFWRYHLQLGWRLLAISLLAVLLLEALARPIVSVLAASSTAPTSALALRLFRVLAPTLLISVATGVGLAAAHALQKYTHASAAGMLGPIGFLAVLLLFGERHGIHAAAWAFGAGQILVLLVLLALLHRQYRARDTIHPSEGSSSALAVQTTGAIALVGMGWLSGIANLQVDLSMASSLGPGAVPSLRYAYRWIQLPAGLFFSTVGVVLLPALSASIALADPQARDRTLRFACRAVAVVLLPSACGLAMLAPDLIGVLYERGAFLAEDTARTAAVLRCYAPSIVAFGYLNIALSTLHAHRQQRLAAWIGIGTVALNGGGNWLLMRSFGVQGIAISTSIVVLGNACFVGLLRPELRALFRQRELGASLLRASFACACMMGALAWLPLLPVWPTKAGLAELLSRTLVGASVYAVALAALRGGEWRELRTSLMPRRS